MSVHQIAVWLATAAVFGTWVTQASSDEIAIGGMAPTTGNVATFGNG